MGWNRLRGNFLSGQVADNPLLVGATTLTSPGLASLPVIANGDYMVLVIDPSGTGGPPEIVYATAHTSLGETATILRAQEDTGAREHAATTTWINSPTTVDYRGRNHDRVWNRGTAAHALDDEFDDGVLDPAFVRVDGASGPVAAHLTWTEAHDVVSAYHTGTDAAAGYHALLKPMGSFAIGNYLETCVTYTGPNQSSPMCGLMLTDGVTHGAGAQIVASYWCNTTFPGKAIGMRRGVNFLTDNIAGVSITPSATAVNYRTHLRLQWVAANSFRMFYSSDGINWIAVAVAQAMTCTPTHLGLFICSWAGTGDYISTFEYLRVS